MNRHPISRKAALAMCFSAGAAAALAETGPLSSASSFVAEMKAETSRVKALDGAVPLESKPKTFSSLAEAPMHPPYYSDDGDRWSQKDAEAAMDAHAAVLKKTGYTIVSEKVTKDRFSDLYEFVVQYADERPDSASDDAASIPQRTKTAAAEAPFDLPYYVDYGGSSDPDEAKKLMDIHVADLKKIGYDVADARVYQREGHEGFYNDNPAKLRGLWFYHYVVRYLDNRPIDLWRTPYTPSEGRYFGTTPEGHAFVTVDQAREDMDAYVASQKKAGFAHTHALIYQREGGAPFYYYYLSSFSR